MIILGIDPGLAIVGWGVIEAKNGFFRPIDYGVITTPAKTDVTMRLEKIYDDMNALIERYKPDCMAIEELFFNTNQTTAIAVAEARGVILLSARHHGLEIGEYTPLQVKQAVVGYGKAEKKQVMMMTASLLRLKSIPRPDDAADALAIAMCHGQSSSSYLTRYLNR